MPGNKRPNRKGKKNKKSMTRAQHKSQSKQHSKPHNAQQSDLLSSRLSMQQSQTPVFSDEVEDFFAESLRREQEELKQLVALPTMEVLQAFSSYLDGQQQYMERAYQACAAVDQLMEDYDNYGTEAAAAIDKEFVYCDGLAESYEQSLWNKQSLFWSYVAEGKEDFDFEAVPDWSHHSPEEQELMKALWQRFAAIDNAYNDLMSRVNEVGAFYEHWRAQAEKRAGLIPSELADMGVSLRLMQQIMDELRSK